MFIRRAEEIVHSQDVVQIFYKNNPVWIEKVDNNRETAYVKFLDNTTRMEVPLIELIEVEKPQ